MEFDLQRTILEGYLPVWDTILSQEDTMESIVPDAFPDVSRIVGTQGNAFLTAKQINGNSAKILGTIRANVLYIADGESVVRSLSLNVPFQCTGDSPKLNDCSQLHAAVCTVSVDTSLINPRKLLLRSEVKVCVCAYASCEREISCDVAGECPESMQKNMLQCQDYLIASVMEKPFSFSDVLQIPGTKPLIDELLTTDVFFGAIDAKYIGKKLVCKGEVSLSVLYRSGQELIPVKFSLPFSQILEMESTYNEGDPVALAALNNAEVVLRDEGLEVTVFATLQAVLWTQRTITVLNDAYSTAAPLDISRNAYSACVSSEWRSHRASARKFCESGIPARQVLSCQAAADPLTLQPQAGSVCCSTAVPVTILYLSEDGCPCQISDVIPISITVDLPENSACHCSCRLSDEALAVPVTGGFELRAEMEFTVHTTKNEEIISIASMAESKTVPESGTRPSVILRMVGPGESLWDIAKSCRATIPDICTANNLSAQWAEPNSVLIIPVKR